MKIIFLLIISLCTTHSQTRSDLLLTEHNKTAETYEDLFPLSVGNYWQYEVKYVSGFYPEDTVIYYANREILLDTLMPNGLVYYDVYDSRNFAWPHKDYLRLDSLTGCIYKYDEYQNEESLLDSLKMIEGDFIITGYHLLLECINVDSINSFGELRQAKHFSCFTPTFDFNYKLVKGIGEIFKAYREDQIVSEIHLSEVTYAKINGEEFGQLVSVEKNFADINSFSLSQNYPNPFNPSTRIKYAIGSRQLVTLRVFDVLGNEIATLVNEQKPAGEYEIEFDGTELTSGIYFYQLIAGSSIETKKMMLIK